MTKAHVVLTDTRIRGFKPPEKGQFDIADARSAGLFLRISAGAKTWVLRFTDPVSGRRQRMTLARYPDLGLAGARERAEQLRGMVAKGQNPVEQKRQDRVEAPKRTFAALAGRYLAEHADRFKRSADADRRNLKLHVLPEWGKRAYADIGRADVIGLVEGVIGAGKPIQANRVQSLVSKIFSFAVDAGLVSANPATRLKKRAKETARSRVLTDAEIRLFWSKIDAPPVSKPVAIALKLALLTGMRAGEVAGIRTTELIAIDDPERAAVLVDAARSKNGCAHLVPLAATARQLVREAMTGGAFLFPGRVGNAGAIDAHALPRAMSRFTDGLPDDDAHRSWKAAPPVPHDLRRTFRTRLSALGVSKEDADACLNHKATDVGSRHYDQYERQAEKRRALNLWAAELAEILGNGGADNVVPLRRQL